MITYITDIRENEPDILKNCLHNPLVIIDENNVELERFEQPINGWTHQLLEKTNSILMSKYDNNMLLEAYLGNQWIGSTEV